MVNHGVCLLYTSFPDLLGGDIHLLAVKHLYMAVIFPIQVFDLFLHWTVASAIFPAGRQDIDRADDPLRPVPGLNLIQGICSQNKIKSMLRVRFPRCV